MMSLRKKRPAIDLTRLSSLIAEDVVISGDVHFSGGLRIDGRIDGNLIAQGADGDGAGLLVLSHKGRVHGSVRCADAVIDGTVVGDLDVGRFLELQSRARISGSIRYRQLQMELGASVRGELRGELSDGEMPAQLPAQPQAESGNVVTLGADKAALAERR
jgi:cytoskeletal protein CcmA (bactofilin family)